jgi:hypothetical protein
MRYFHKTKNQFWKPTINIDKLWSLVPKEEKDGLTEDSEVVPVIDTLHHGYGKVLGNGQCVHVFLYLYTLTDHKPGSPNFPSSSRPALCQRSPSKFPQVVIL